MKDVNLGKRKTSIEAKKGDGNGFVIRLFKIMASPRIVDSKDIT